MATPRSQKGPAAEGVALEISKFGGARKNKNDEILNRRWSRDGPEFVLELHY